MPEKPPAQGDIAAQVIADFTSGVLALAKDGSVIMSNPASATHLLVDASALEPGASLNECEWAEPFMAILDEVCETGEPAARRSVFVDTADGGKKEIGVSGAPLHDEKGVEGTVFLFVDMTERRQLERAAELNRQLATLGELTAGVVHELRSPVMVISGMAELIGRQLADTPGVQEKIELISQECKHLEVLVSQFLSFSRPYDIHAAWCSPEEIATRAAKLVTVRAQEKGVTIKREIGKDLPKMLGDAGKIVQVIVNLMNNAVDAVDEKSGVVTLTAHESTGQIVFTVVDNGPGIDTADEDLFQPFVTKKEGGTGLGLSIVSRIVHAHRGTVSAHNGLEGGAVFAVSLPVGNAE